MVKQLPGFLPHSSPKSGHIVWTLALHQGVYLHDSPLVILADKFTSVIKSLEKARAAVVQLEGACVTSLVVSRRVFPQVSSRDPTMCVLVMLSGLLVLLAACSGPAHSAVITENNLPILWAEASSQLSDLPQQDNVVTINPWNYQQRMTLYRLQLAASDQYMGSMGPNTTEGNPLWSLPLQLGWKLRSGKYGSIS